MDIRGSLHLVAVGFVLAVLCAAPATAADRFRAEVTALAYEAGDHFGAVTVCDRAKTAFVGGFRVNREHRDQADLLSVSLNSDDAVVDPKVTSVELGIDVNGGAVVAPGNDNIVYALPERETVIRMFAINDSCSRWNLDEFDIGPKEKKSVGARALGFTSWPAGMTFYASASIGSNAAAFAGGQYAGTSGPQFYNMGLWISPQEGGYTAGDIELSVARSALVGVTTPKTAWFVGGYYLDGDGYPFTVSHIDVVDENFQVNSTFVSLAEGRAFAGGAYAAGKVVIAGGAVAFFPDSFDGVGLNFTNSVEIFDVATGKRTTSTMPGPARGFLTGVAVGEYVVFAGGIITGLYDASFNVVEQVATDAIDVYHVPSNTWLDTARLKGGARLFASGVAIEDLGVVLIAPGSYYNGSQRLFTDKIDAIYIHHSSGASHISVPYWLSLFLLLLLEVFTA